jgi:hypothetical protein
MLSFFLVSRYLLQLVMVIPTISSKQRGESLCITMYSTNHSEENAGEKHGCHRSSFQPRFGKGRNSENP